MIRRSAATVVRARSPHASCSRTMRSPEPSSASLTASTSTPAPVTVTTGGGGSAARAAVDDPHREVEALGLGDDVGQAGAVRATALIVTSWRPWSASGSG